MALPYLTGQTPAPSATNVLVTVNPTVTVTSTTNQIVKANTDLYLVLATGQVQVYDGGTDTFHADYPGTITASGYGWIISFNPDANLYETYIYGIRVVAQDDIAQAIDETYTWSTERLGRISNSGFEAPGDNTGEAAYWEANGEDPSSQLGIKRGRVQNPVIWTPPEGDFILALGTTDLTETFPDAMSQSWVSDPVDFTAYLTLRAQFKISLSGTQPSGVTYTIQLKIDETVIWTRTYTDADAAELETGAIVVDTSSYSGFHVVKIQFQRAVGDWAMFDQNNRFSETFENWGGEASRYLASWDDSLAATVITENFSTGW